MEKTYILQKIKRTSETNNGQPLGEARFASATGIKKADWFGRYWVRWGDALREAGFLPNQFQGAYDENDLLEKYARLTRELNRLPVKGDLLLKAHTDASFPSTRPFSRLGGKSQLVAKLAEFCKRRSGYDDVLRLCDGYVPRAGKNQETGGLEGYEVGFVYLMKSGRHYKIGKTNAAGRREYELALQLPEKAVMVHVIRTDDPTGIEAYWHKRFEAKRKNGEWFELGAADVAAFKRRRFM